MSVAKTLATFNIAKALSEFLGRPLEVGDLDHITEIGMECASIVANRNSEAWRARRAKEGFHPEMHGGKELQEKLQAMLPISLPAPWNNHMKLKHTLADRMQSGDTQARPPA